MRDVPQIVAVLVTVSLAHDELGFDKCTSPLGMWMIVYAIGLMISLTISWSIFSKLSNVGVQLGQAWLQYVG